MAGCGLERAHEQTGVERSSVRFHPEGDRITRTTPDHQRNVDLALEFGLEAATKGPGRAEAQSDPIHVRTLEPSLRQPKKRRTLRIGLEDDRTMATHRGKMDANSPPTFLGAAIIVQSSCGLQQMADAHPHGLPTNRKPTGGSGAGADASVVVVRAREHKSAKAAKVEDTLFRPMAVLVRMRVNAMDAMDAMLWMLWMLCYGCSQGFASTASCDQSPTADVAAAARTDRVEWRRSSVSVSGESPKAAAYPGGAKATAYAHERDHAPLFVIVARVRSFRSGHLYPIGIHPLGGHCIGTAKFCGSSCAAAAHRAPAQNPATTMDPCDCGDWDVEAPATNATHWHPRFSHTISGGAVAGAECAFGYALVPPS